jgi:hypothetical protein
MKLPKKEFPIFNSIFFSTFWKQQFWTHQISTTGSSLFLLISTPIGPIWKNIKLICNLIAIKAAFYFFIDSIRRILL